MTSKYIPQTNPMKLADTAKALWSKLTPMLVIRIEWSNIASVVKSGMFSELNGDSLEWAEGAMKVWKRQGELLRNQIRLVLTGVVRKLAIKSA